MPGRRRPRRLRAPALAVVLIALLAAPPPAAGATPAPSAAPSATPGPFSSDLTGHWEAAELGGIDLVQGGTRLTGASPTGVIVNGTVEGRHADFVYWEGASYEAAAKDERGRGTIDLAQDGRTIAVAWRSEAGTSRLPPRFTAVRVNPILEPIPAEWNVNLTVEQVAFFVQLANLYELTVEQVFTAMLAPIPPAVVLGLPVVVAWMDIVRDLCLVVRRR